MIEKIKKNTIKELERQQYTLEMIASENFTSQNVLDIVGSVLTNKYAEGYPGKRYYGGCEHVDSIEDIARDCAKNLFKCEYANVQPHSGSQANMAMFMTILKVGDTVLGLDLAHGGHLTHGSKVNFSGKMYNFISYGVCKDKHTVDFDELHNLVKKFKPKLIICGGSAYPRFIEFEKFREIADSCNAMLMADIAHPSGLIASGVHPSPWPYCDFATSTTHKTLRGPRGGLILMGKDFENTWGEIAIKSKRTKMVSELIDSSVMPGIQGGPLMHVIGGKAIAFQEAMEPEYKQYCEQVVLNAKTLAQELQNYNFNIITGGTDTHLLLIDLTNKNISGKKAELFLENAGITVNKNMIPFDTKGPMITSGIRIGTPAITTRGMKEQEMKFIAAMINKVIENFNEPNKIDSIKNQIFELCKSFPIYDKLNYEMS